MVEKTSDEALTVEQQDWVRFLTSDGLAEKAGCPSSDFDKMVVKEFADNAADIGGFGYKTDEDKRSISIWNGGSGLSSEGIARLDGHVIYLYCRCSHSAGLPVVDLLNTLPEATTVSQVALAARCKGCGVKGNIMSTRIVFALPE